MKNERKIGDDFQVGFWMPFLRFWEDFGVEKGGIISKNLSEMRSGNEKGDFMKNAIPPMK